MRKICCGLIAVAITSSLATSVQAQTIDVLVTNDDSLGAPGIDAMVNELLLNSNLNVTVVAPLTNQSGSGDSVSFGVNTIAVTAGTTASGVPGTAVDGFPADSVLYALQEMGLAPDIVVSGINSGQNLGREVGGNTSGTVGAALTAARMGIPAIAVSAQFVSNDYATAATYVANIVEDFRQKSKIGKKLTNKNGLDQFAILNINVPSCNVSGGSINGVEVVPMAQINTVTGYTEGPPGTFTAVVDSETFLGFANCNSVLEDPEHDIDAFNNGYISVTALNPDKTVDNKLKRFKFLRNIDFN